MENNLTTNLSLDQQSISFLEETSRWARFLAIMGFIGIGLLILLGLFMGSVMNKIGGPMSAYIPTGLITVLYMLIGALYFFPVLYLYRFSVRMKVALHESSSENLTAAFENLKSLFRFMGILTIIVLSIYLIVIVSAIIFGLISRI